MSTSARAMAAVALAACVATPLRAGAADTTARDRRLAAWSADWADLCYRPETGTGPSELKTLRARLDDPAVFGGYFAGLLEGSGAVLCLDNRTPGCRGYFEPASNVIALLEGLSYGEKLLIAAHELRHAAQSADGFGPSVEYDRHENVRLTYALEADAQAITTLFAWSERSAGRPDAWEAALTLERYADIPEAFAAALDGGGDLTTATRTAFEAWYASDWRRESYYLSACSHVLDLLDETHSVESYARLPADHFDTLCRLPDGTDYGCTAAPEIASDSRDRD
jgi:Putative metallopeptidase family (DUF6782)